MVSVHVIQGAELCQDWRKQSDPYTLCLITKFRTFNSTNHACPMQCGAYFYEIAHVDGTKIKSLPDSSFTTIEVTKDGTKVRHFAYRDMDGNIDINQLIYCLGTFSNETWLRPENIETARKCLEEHYYRFKLNQTKEANSHQH